MRMITAIMGDGIGPEVIEATMRVVDATGIEIKWERVLAGMTALTEKSNPLPQETLDSIARNKVVLKGPCDTPIGGGFASVNVALRKKFDLYCNIRPIKSMPGIKSRYENVDLIVFREGIEGVYGGQEYWVNEKGERITGPSDFAKSEAIITARNSRRFFNKVIRYCLDNLRRKITIVHKANIQKKTHGLFLETGKNLFEKYHTLGYQVEDRIVDNLCMQLVLDPTQFDVIAAINEHGDIISELCAGLVGGLGVVPGANLGDEYAIFEAAHGTWPQAAGKNIANPTALILSAAMMLDYLGEQNAAEKVRKAVVEVIAEGSQVTGDINREKCVSTTLMADAIVKKLYH